MHNTECYCEKSTLELNTSLDIYMYKGIFISNIHSILKYVFNIIKNIIKSIFYKLKNVVKKALFTLNVVNKDYLANPCVTNFHGIMLLESIFYFSIKIFKLWTDVQLMLVHKNIIILIL